MNPLIQKLQQAKSDVELAQNKVKAYEQELIATYAKHKVGDIIDGKRSMSGTPCRLMIADVDVMVCGASKTGNGTHITIWYAGKAMNKAETHTVNIDASHHESLEV